MNASQVMCIYLKKNGSQTVRRRCVGCSAVSMSCFVRPAPLQSPGCASRRPAASKQSCIMLLEVWMLAVEKHNTDMYIVYCQHASLQKGPSAQGLQGWSQLRLAPASFSLLPACRRAFKSSMTTSGACRRRWPRWSKSSVLQAQPSQLAAAQQTRPWGPPHHHLKRPRQPQ